MQLFQTIQSDDVNTDRAIQQVRDIFDISTKSLDMFGRKGAFRHIIRRQLAMTDTGLQLNDSRELSNLPLSGDGRFGSKLEKFLKFRKETNITLDDLLLDFPKKMWVRENRLMKMHRRQCPRKVSITKISLKNQYSF